MIVPWLLVAQFPVSIELGWYSLAKPYAIGLRETVKLIIDAANFVIVIALLIANDRITLESAKLTSLELASAKHWANFGIRIGLGIAAAITGATLIDRARRLLRRPSNIPSSLLHTA